MIIKHTCLKSKCFQLGGTYAIIGRESYDSTLPHKLTGSHVAYGTNMTTSTLSWIKFYKI